MKGSMSARLMYAIVLLIILLFVIALYYLAANRIIEKMLLGG